MNRVEYVAELESRLAELPRAERDEAINYYAEYLNEAGPQYEAAAIEKLGSPSKAAAQILAGYSSGYVVAPDGGKKEKSGKKRKNGALILAIATSPVTVPLAAAAFAGILALAASAAAVALSIFAAWFAIIFSGALSVGIAIFYPGLGFATCLVAAGSGLILIGLGILLFIPAKSFANALRYFIINVFSSIINKIKRPAPDKIKESEAHDEKIQ